MTYGFHPEAEAKHLETIAWYESRSARVRYASNRIAIGWSASRIFVESICEDSRSRYIYREVDGQVEMLAVAHHRRRPTYWTVRVPPSSADRA